MNIQTHHQTDRRPPVSLAPCATLLACLALLVAPPIEADERADALARRAMEAVGAAHWEATPYVTFTFVGRRHHWWDKTTGMHRLEGSTREGEPTVVVHDIDDRGREGQAWVAGVPVEGERKTELLESAYEAWVNDTYWLAVPFKLMDPGVHRAHAGQRVADGVTYDLLELTFGEVGLTPDDRYRLYVHPETGLVERWDYVLQSQNPPPTVWIWEDWGTYGPPGREVRLSGRRVQEGNPNRVLTLTPIALPEELPEGVFTSPELLAGSSGEAAP